MVEFSVCSVSTNRRRSEGAGMILLSFFYGGTMCLESGDHKEAPINLEAGKLCF